MRRKKRLTRKERRQIKKEFIRRGFSGEGLRIRVELVEMFEKLSLEDKKKVLERAKRMEEEAATSSPASPDRKEAVHIQELD